MDLVMFYNLMILLSWRQNLDSKELMIFNYVMIYLRSLFGIVFCLCCILLTISDRAGRFFSFNRSTSIIFSKKYKLFHIPINLKIFLIYFMFLFHFIIIIKLIRLILIYDHLRHIRWLLSWNIKLIRFWNIKIFFIQIFVFRWTLVIIHVLICLKSPFIFFFLHYRFFKRSWLVWLTFAFIFIISFFLFLDYASALTRWFCRRRLIFQCCVFLCQRISFEFLYWSVQWEILFELLRLTFINLILFFFLFVIIFSKIESFCSHSA